MGRRRVPAGLWAIGREDARGRRTIVTDAAGRPRNRATDFLRGLCDQNGVIESTASQARERQKILCDAI